MRIVFKSLPVVSEQTTHTYDSVITRTVYNLGDVRDHVTDVPLAKLLFSWGTAWRTGLLVAPPTAFVLLLSGWNPAAVPVFALVLLALWAGLAYFASEEMVKTKLMTLAATKDRRVLAGVRLAVVETSRWKWFVGRLEHNPRARLDLIRQLEARRAVFGDDLAERLRLAFAARADEPKPAAPPPERQS